MGPVCTPRNATKKLARFGLTNKILLCLFLVNVSRSDAAELAYQNLCKFFSHSSTNFPFGRLAETEDGSFWGAASGSFCLVNGGPIFKLSLERVLTNVFQFNGTNGTGAEGLMLASDGYFY